MLIRRSKSNEEDIESATRDVGKTNVPDKNSGAFYIQRIWYYEREIKGEGYERTETANK